MSEYVYVIMLYGVRVVSGVGDGFICQRNVGGGVKYSGVKYSGVLIVAYMVVDIPLLS